MSRQSIALLAVIAAPLLAGLTIGAKAQEPRISGPAVHENLAVYFVHGPSAPGPAPLTLAEAMRAGKVIVHETGNVNTLSIENTGGEEVFVQAGDIVKGGQQDRVLTVSFLVPPRSGRMPIAAYCVEQGRWSARGAEDATKFASSDKSLPSREARLALLTPSQPAPAQATTSSPTPPAGVPPEAAQRRLPDRTVASTLPSNSYGTSRQSEVWQSVSAAQRKLSANVGANVAAPDSASSLQLSLENAELAKVRAAYIAALEPQAGGASDIVGYVVAVSGKIEGGDVYPSNALFRKMWAKQLDAASTAAIAEKSATPSAPPPGHDAVRAFLAGVETGHPISTDLAGTELTRETKATEKAVLAETRRKSGGFVHRAYLAR